MSMHMPGKLKTGQEAIESGRWMWFLALIAIACFCGAVGYWLSAYRRSAEDEFVTRLPGADRQNHRGYRELTTDAEDRELWAIEQECRELGKSNEDYMRISRFVEGIGAFQRQHESEKWTVGKIRRSDKVPYYLCEVIHWYGNLGGEVYLVCVSDREGVGLRMVCFWLVLQS